MNILIWKGYGEIDAYDISTPEKFKSVIETMIDCVDGWGIDNEVNVVKKHIEKHPDDLKEIRRAFNTLKNAINPAYDNDNFESLFISELK